MARRKEYLLGLHQNIWINNESVIPGTFDRLRETVDKDGQPTSMSLRRLNLTERPIDLSEETIYVEHQPYRTDPLDRVPSKDLIEYLKKRLKPKRISVVNSQVGLTSVTETPEMGSDYLRYVSGLELRVNGIIAIDIQIDGHKNSYPTSAIAAIFKNPHRDNVIISWFGPDGMDIFYSTYKLSKITQTRRASRKNPAILKAEEILARKRLS